MGTDQDVTSSVRSRRVRLLKPSAATHLVTILRCAAERAPGTMAGMFLFDTSYDPLHLQVIPRAFTDEEVEAHFDQVELYYMRRSAADAPVALLADARLAQAPSALARKRVALAFERLSPVLAQRAVAHAIVVNSPLIHGALTAIYWIKRPDWPVQTFLQIEDADRWLRQSFVAQGRVAPLAPARWWDPLLKRGH